MADTESRKRPRVQCPYAASEEHSLHDTFRSSRWTGVCEYHICRGAAGCPNAMLPLGSGGPYCARPECQAFWNMSLDVPVLPPELWYAIAARTPDTTDVAYLRFMSEESHRGVEMYVHDQRIKKDEMTPDPFVVSAQRARSSRSRRHEYMAALDPATRQTELVRAAKESDFMGVQLAIETGATYNAEIGLHISRASWPNVTLDWLEQAGVLSDQKTQDELAERLVRADRDDRGGYSGFPYKRGILWLAKKGARVGPHTERIQRYMMMAARVGNEYVILLLRKTCPEVPFPHGICPLVLRCYTARNTAALMANEVLMAAHYPQTRPERFPCAPHYCSWAREFTVLPGESDSSDDSDEE